MVRAAQSQAAAATPGSRSQPRSPRKTAGRVDPHEILRRHQEKRRQEALLQESASLNTATSQHYQQQAMASAPTQSAPTNTNTYRLAPLASNANGEVVMDGRARQAALARYRKSQLKPIVRTGGVCLLPKLGWEECQLLLSRRCCFCSFRVFFGSHRSR